MKELKATGGRSLIAWIMVRSKAVSTFVEGKKMVLYKNGEFLRQNMNAVQVCHEDILQGVRKSALTEDLQKIDTIYIERNGEISSIRKA